MTRTGLIIASLAVLMMMSCGNDLEIIHKIIDTEIEPDLTGKNVEMQHFDSARLQVRMVTPLMLQFTMTSEQRREFPEGIHVWLYKNTGELNAEITANWAKHNLETNIWEARNNVVVNDVVDGRVIETEQLFWDVNEAIVYSERFTRVTQSDGTMASGDTFWARQDFSAWTLNNRSGVGRTIIFVREDENQTDDDED